MASMEELYNTIADIWDSYDIYRQEHADKYGEAEESPSTIEQIIFIMSKRTKPVD